MSLPRVTATGNLAANVELRVTSNGSAVGSFVLMCNERKRDMAGEWVDGQTMPLSVTVWNQLAENCAGSLGRGDAVTVSGVLVEDRYEKDGVTQYRIKLVADDVAASLRFACAEIARRKAPATAPAEGEPATPIRGRKSA